MTYHILHITSPNCRLTVDKGLLFCAYKNGDAKMIAINDIKALIIATFGVSFSGSCLAKLLENNVVVLHCDDKFKPTGLSLPLERIVRQKVFYNQIARNEEFELMLWKQILKSKVSNQAKNLDLMGITGHNLYKLINRPLMNEANIARYYWQNYFKYFQSSLKREHKDAKTFENGCLNYGYAILNSLIHRSVIIHGMLAGLGIHHKGKYKSTPFVYDLMEPYRPFIDYYFYKFTNDFDEAYEFEDFKAWALYVADCIKNYKLKITDISYKIVDTIDIYVEKFADAYLNFDFSNIFMPELEKQYLHINKHRNREYAE